MIEKSVFLIGFALRCRVRKRSLEEVQVLRREGHEAAIGQPGGKVVIGGIVARKDVGRPAFQAVLADDHRPPLARLDVLGHQQHAVGEHLGQHVQHDFVADPLLARRNSCGSCGFAGSGRMSKRPITSVSKYSR